jgi:hypothetical protein
MLLPGCLNSTGAVAIGFELQLCEVLIGASAVELASHVNASSSAMHGLQVGQHHLPCGPLYLC